MFYINLRRILTIACILLAPAAQADNRADFFSFLNSADDDEGRPVLPTAEEASPLTAVELTQFIDVVFERNDLFWTWQVTPMTPEKIEYEIRAVLPLTEGTRLVIEHTPAQWSLRVSSPQIDDLNASAKHYVFVRNADHSPKYTFGSGCDDLHLFKPKSGLIDRTIDTCEPVFALTIRAVLEWVEGHQSSN